MPRRTNSSVSTVVERSKISFVVDECQEDFDIRFFEAILSRNENNVDVLAQLVELMARAGNYKRALALDQRLVRLRPHDCFARYNLACTRSMLGNVEQALEALDQALRLGYDDFVHMDADSDLDAIRLHPGYIEILERHGLAG